MIPTAWKFILIALAGWIHRQQEDVIEYLKEENRVLREQLGLSRARFTDAQRRRLAAKARSLPRGRLRDVATLVTPETLLGWYRKLIARKYDGSGHRGPGRPPKSRIIRDHVVLMARENPRWGYTRIVGALRNLGHKVARTTVKRILLEHGMNPAPQRSKRLTTQAAPDQSGSVSKGRPGADLHHAGQPDPDLDAEVLATTAAPASALPVVATSLLSDPIREILHSVDDFPDGNHHSDSEQNERYEGGAGLGVWLGLGHGSLDYT